MLLAGGIIAFLFAGVSAVAFLPTGVELDDDVTDDTPPQVPEYDGDTSLLNDLVSNVDGGEIAGTDGPDRLLASEGVDIFQGGEGNDLVANGGKGDDQFFLNAGNDFANGGEGNDRIDGNGGDDTIKGGSGNDELNGLFGDDFLDGGRGEDILRGGVGDDTIVARQDNDQIFAGAGNDTAYGGGGLDKVFGGDGNDTLYGGGQKDFLNGGTGDDVLVGGFWADKLVGGAGEDQIFGEFGRDLIFGGPDNDVIFAGVGDDKVDDGTGNDVVSLGDGDDEIRNSAGDDVVFGDAGNDFIIDGAGDDIYFGGAGADDIRDGDGDDIYFAVTLEEGGSVDPGASDGDNIVLKSGLDLVFAGQDDTITFQGGDGIVALGDYGAATDSNDSALIRNLADDSGFAYFYAGGDDQEAPEIELAFREEEDLTLILANGIEVGQIEGGNWEDRGLTISPIPYDPALVAENGIEVLQGLLEDEILLEETRDVPA